MKCIPKEIEWGAGAAHYTPSDINPGDYLLCYSVMNKDLTEGFGDTVRLSKCKEACNAGKYVAVPQNPFTRVHDTKVLYGGSPLVLARKVLKQIEKWREADHGKKQEQHPVQEQPTGEEDCLPFN